MCGVARRPHPRFGSVVVITVAGSFGPRALTAPACVRVLPTRSSGASASAAAATAAMGMGTGDLSALGPSVDGGELAEFARVLESVPVPRIHERVADALRAGDGIELDYRPGSCTATFEREGGASEALTAEWGVGLGDEL